MGDLVDEDNLIMRLISKQSNRAGSTGGTSCGLAGNQGEEGEVKTVDSQRCLMAEGHGYRSPYSRVLCSID